MELTDLERAVLALEARDWQSAGPKEREITESLGLSVPRYYQMLNRLMDSQEALAYAPVLINRLRRVRAERRAER